MHLLRVRHDPQKARTPPVPIGDTRRRTATTRSSVSLISEKASSSDPGIASSRTGRAKWPRTDCHTRLVTNVSRQKRIHRLTVRTLTANSTDCSRDCPAKPLAQYIAENGAYAGMNGTYLCPPDYPACANKVNSYDYAVYNSDLRRWINRPALIGQNADEIVWGVESLALLDLAFAKAKYAEELNAVEPVISNQ